jgi:hypothetical protein
VQARQGADITTTNPSYQHASFFTLRALVYALCTFTQVGRISNEPLIFCFFYQMPLIYSPSRSHDMSLPVANSLVFLG